MMIFNFFPHYLQILCWISLAKCYFQLWWFSLCVWVVLSSCFTYFLGLLQVLWQWETYLICWARSCFPTFLSLTGWCTACAVSLASLLIFIGSVWFTMKWTLAMFSIVPCVLSSYEINLTINFQIVNWLHYLWAGSTK